MKVDRLRISVAGVIAFLWALGLLSIAGAQQADLVLHNGKVLTVDKNFTVAQAVAIRDGTIVAVGKNADVLKAAGPRAKKIDLKGKTVIPGLIDGHAHMDREGLKYLYPSLGGARSIDDIVKIVEREVKKVKPGEWVITMPVGDPPFYLNVPGVLKENRLPTRWDLDRVSPNNPVYIRGIWGFWNRPPVVSIANSYALKLAGITKETAAPYDGITIQKDPASGEPTGVFSENSFVPTVEFSLMKVVPRFTHDLRVTALRDAMKRYNSSGTTSIYEGHGISAEVIRAYNEVWAKGELTVRSYLVVSPTPGKSATEMDEMMRDWAPYATGPGFGDDMLRIGGLFIQAGGNPNVARLRTAEAPYTAWAAYYYEAYNQQKFREIAFAAAKNGLRVNTIASGGKSLDAALALFEEINKSYPIADKRWVVEHVGEASARNIEQMKRLGIVPTVLGSSQIWKGGAFALKSVPPERHNEFRPYKSIVEAGLPLVLALIMSPHRLYLLCGLRWREKIGILARCWFLLRSSAGSRRSGP